MKSEKVIPKDKSSGIWLRRWDLKGPLENIVVSVRSTELASDTPWFLPYRAPFIRHRRPSRSNNHRTVQRCPSTLRSSTSEGHRDVEPYTPSTASSPACCFGCSPGDLCCRATGLQVYLSYAHLLVVGDVTIQKVDIQGGIEIVIGLLSIIYFQVPKYLISFVCCSFVPAI